MLGGMFRTRLDLELRLRRASGPPFFDLRESITNIIHEHVKEPEVGMQETYFLTHSYILFIEGDRRLHWFWLTLL